MAGFPVTARFLSIFQERKFCNSRAIALLESLLYIELKKPDAFHLVRSSAGSIQNSKSKILASVNWGILRGKSDEI